MRTSSFENDAVDREPDTTPEPIADPTSASDVAGATDEHESDNEEVGLVTSALEREVAEHKDKYVRLYAEFENFKRRAVRDRHDAEHRGMQNLLRGLLETFDDVARFANVDPESTTASTVVEGVAMVEKKLMKSLAGHGLVVVNPMGQPFDPAVHEAITTSAASDEDEDDIVSQVFQVGYVFNGTLLRPARVAVMQWNG